MFSPKRSCFFEGEVTPMVAYDLSAGDLDKMCRAGVDYSKVEDEVVKLCPRGGTVKLKLIAGGKPKPVGSPTPR